MRGRTNFRRAVRHPRAEITRAIGARSAMLRIAARRRRDLAVRTAPRTTRLCPRGPITVHRGRVLGTQTPPAGTVLTRLSKGMAAPTIADTRNSRRARTRRHRRRTVRIRRPTGPTQRRAAVMAVEARRMVAVQLPMAAVQLPTAVAQLLTVVVAAEAGRIIDPETFPKGPPISSRRAFGFLGFHLSCRRASHNSPMVRVFYR